MITSKDIGKECLLRFAYKLDDGNILERWERRNARVVVVYENGIIVRIGHTALLIPKDRVRVFEPRPNQTVR